MLVSQVDKGENNADREDPLGDIKGNGRLNFRGPFVEDEELNSGKGVDSVHSYRYRKGDEEIAIGHVGEAVAGLEVVKLLERKLLVYHRTSFRPFIL